MMKPPSGGPITGPDQRRHRHPCHRIDQRALVDRAQQHQPPDRRHHRAAHALQDAGDDEMGDVLRQRAADRPDHEHADRDREHHARAEPVGGPAAGRDEHGERQQIGRDRKLQRQRAGADVSRDRRQRRRNHRRVHVLHEQGGGDDQRDQAFFGHRDRETGERGRRGACIIPLSHKPLRNRAYHLIPA